MGRHKLPLFGSHQYIDLQPINNKRDPTALNLVLEPLKPIVFWTIITSTAISLACPACSQAL